MRKRIFLAFAVLTISVPAYSQTVNTEQKKAAAEVIATIAKWADAVRDRDLKALDELFDDEMIVTTHDGSVRGKAGELDALKPSPGMRTLSVSNEDVLMKVMGDAVVATALVKMAHAAGSREMTTAMRYTAVFFKKGGSWKLVALHTTPVPPGGPSQPRS